MRRCLVVALSLLALWMVGDHGVLAQNANSPADNCDPSRRKDNPNLQRAKDAKKAQLRQRGYPERFMKLIDREECIACVDEAGDAFHIMIVYQDNDYAPKDYKTGKRWTHVSHVWDPETEIVAREKTKDGTIKGYYILNTLKKGCRCCGDTADGHTTPESYSDWDEDLDANKDHLIPFDQSNVGALPDDLEHPSDKWVSDPVPVPRTFEKPAKKQAHAACPACQSTVDTLNAAYDALDKLWSGKIDTLNARELKEVELAKTENEIRLLWYKQRSVQMSSAANQQRIEDLEVAEQRLNDEIRAGVRDVEAVDAKIAAQEAAIAPLEKAAADCTAKCATATASTITETPPAVAVNTAKPVVPPTPPPPPPAASCFGDSCTSEWNSCEASGSCRPIEDDCGVPGVCTDSPGPSNRFPFIDLSTPMSWDTNIKIDIDIRVQEKVVDLIDPISFPQYAQPYEAGNFRTHSQNESVYSPNVYPMPSLVIPASQPQGVRQWFDPLGLLARNLIANIERWRGSVGPRPFITTEDLKLIDRYSGGQAAGLPSGVHVLLNDQGGSTGKTLVMQILNLSGKPVRLSAKPFAVQPIKQQAQQQVQQAFSRLAKAAPVQLNLSAYCVEFLKAPPGASTFLKLAPADVQQKYAPMSKILQSSYRVAKGNALHPDSNPAAYTDSIKQWAIWTVEQKLTESKYTDAFVGHTKKNVEAAGQQWSKAAEDTVRKVSPNRWRDIVKILQGAGVPVPQ